jgi:F-type H+-transporting ATPase subunit delta
MSNRASANRYAKALFDVILKEAQPEQAERGLAAFVDVVSGNADLQKVLINPAVPISGKRGIVQQLVARVNPSKPVAKLMMLLADRDRLELLPDLLAAYRERLMDHLQIVRAEVVTAVPLPKERADELQRRLSQLTGQKVTMEARVDPSIIGGVVARVGSTVYDGSIATQLARMKDKLTENV